MKFIVAGALALAISGPVSAEVFNGPFVGVQAGWNHEKVGQIDGVSVDRSKDSFVGGAYAGYDRTIGSSIVLGVEAGLNTTTSDTLGRTGRDQSARFNPNYGFDLTARAGYLLNPKTLVYVRGGYDNVRASVRIIDNAKVSDGHETFDGWLVGGGVERAISSRISARVEYRYSDLSGGYDRQQALVGVSYHF